MKEGALAEAAVAPVPMHQNKKAACMTREEVEELVKEAETRNLKTVEEGQKHYQ